VGVSEPPGGGVEGGRGAGSEAAAAHPGVATAPPRLAAVKLTKVFPGVMANDGVSFDLRPGEVHALLGENGSGKTTLCKMLTGLYRPDGGTLAVDGAPVAFHSPRQAYGAGIFMVQQHFSLVERLTVAENVVLGLPRASRPSGRSRRSESVTAVADRQGLAVDPDRYIWQLSVGERQKVEILKALYRGARTLILDEPTTVLTPQECSGLFSTLRVLAAAGTSVIFISHKLREVLDVSDRVTILRKGAAVATIDARREAVSPAQLAQLMVGRSVELSTRRPHSADPGAAAALRVDAVTAQNEFGRVVVDDVSLTVRAGEIVGLAGVAGNGQRELAEVVAGLQPSVKGAVWVGDRRLPRASPRAAIAAGLAYVPEDRFGTGLVRDLTVSDNLVLKQFCGRQFSHWSLLDGRAVAGWADSRISEFAIKGERSTTVRQLSGGNAQKVLLARELSSQPKALLVAAPTRGLDVAAMDAVRRLLIDAADNGIGVLLISEDLDELLEMADRIVVMYRGTIAGSLPRAQADRDRIGLMMAGAA
jgi:ABC-type uncharacterized transport system ATPase subunit